FPRLSPKKSWEGFLGGLTVSAILAIVISTIFKSSLSFNGQFPLSIFSSILLAFLFTTFGFIGDIAESSFKRACKLSDSGSVLPGLGGAMDVLDSLIPAAPIFYAFLLLATA
ncbi:MAG: phosphatidate cytidylyltransferase, partial [Lentisphaeria bacterium]